MLSSTFKALLHNSPLFTIVSVSVNNTFSMRLSVASTQTRLVTMKFASAILKECCFIDLVVQPPTPARSTAYTAPTPRRS
jgi:hypothetical protein